MTEAIAGARCATHPNRDAHATCARCGDFACVDCISLTSDGAFCASCLPLSGEPFPWERRAEIGILRAGWSTLRGVWLEPQSIFRSGFRERATWPALAFGMAISVPIHTLVSLSMIFMHRDLPHTGARTVQRLITFLSSTEYRVVTTALAPITFVIGLLANAAFWWVGLRLVSGARRPYLHFLRVSAYVGAATAPLSLLTLAPPPTSGVLALLVAGCSVVLEALALRALNGIELWRVAVGFALAAGLVVGALCPITFFAIWSTTTF